MFGMEYRLFSDMKDRNSQIKVKNIHLLCYKTYIFTFTFLKTNSTDPIKSMSKETLTSTFTELRKNFLRLAMRFLPNKEDADDALQEAFFRLWRHADKIVSIQ